MKKQIAIAVLPFLTLLATNASAEVAPPAPPLAVHATVLIINLQANGYPLIKSIELSKGTYKVNAVDLQGLNINLDVDSQTGRIINPKKIPVIKLTLLDAIKKVEAKGYHGVYQAESDTSGTYIIHATDAKAKKVTLKVNATTGDIKESWW